ncbi:biotin-independent malonate decarboxylase subunit gamma [Pseudomonas asiatica]|uniref:biotin-independent malonate decarboxylase subunit gamma n=1 Tax=Pseudomonas TaxID=286 RepID=UPI00209AB5BE|nr:MULTISPECIES: biotin-independent malonate decarboxylase subunit gamma [Pseudomonas]MCO7525970.1 biotin-independent malonate decarboxylase subunit gamma [Pseudomonas asiatica]MDH4431875.1 biotin-independent malonate decarboxylase subunit gamma [Pseudomonas shirazica]
MNRALNWLPGLTGGQALPGYPASLRVIDGELDNRLARFIAVVPDTDNPFPRARSGEVGLLEGWGLAKAVSEAVEADRQGQKRAIVAVIDVPSQAYGRREEALGIHQALAAAVQAYAQARLAGHPVIGLLVGKAMSGAFLAHGYQAQRLIALDDAGVMVHAMGKAAAARITLRSVEQLEALAAEVPPMAYDLASYASLGLLWRRLTVDNAETPSSADIAQVRACLADAVRDIGSSSDLSSRLAGENRSASRQVREQLRRQWQGA